MYLSIGRCSVTNLGDAPKSVFVLILHPQIEVTLLNLPVAHSYMLLALLL